MKKVVLMIFVTSFLCSATVQAVTMDWVTVGDPGNAGDTEIMTTDGTTGYGSVNYTYRIGKYEVTNNQYCECLNAVAKDDHFGLYSLEMGSFSGSGITVSGSPGSYSYSVKEGRGNNPVNFVNWYSSLRFINWLHNGQPTGAQDDSTTEDGAYDMSLGASVVRKPNAQVWLPSEDEWYKAAYYKGGGTDAGYWDYATQSDICPISEAPPGGSNSANYKGPDGDQDWAVGGEHISDVGAYISSLSAYGTFDQTANMQEWTEALITESGYPDQGVIAGHRSHRGGQWNLTAPYLPASHRYSCNPEVTHGAVGFRVASIPEPATILILGLGGLIPRRRKRN